MAFRMRQQPALPEDQPEPIDVTIRPAGVPAIAPAKLAKPTATSAQPLELVARLFGKFSVVVNGTNFNLCSSYAGRSMLAYMLAHPRMGATSDVLENLFWPEAPTGSARNNRNVAMSNLRSALKLITEQSIIEHRTGKYVFARGCSVQTDVQEFEQQLATARWLEANRRVEEAMACYESALGLYEDDFMMDELYQDWVLRKRDELRNLYVGALDRLSRFYFERGNYSACIEAGHQILTRDRWREDVHCLLMRSYARQNQQCFAFKQYRDCIEALRSEFNMPPSAETLQLHEQLLRREPV